MFDLGSFALGFTLATASSLTAGKQSTAWLAWICFAVVAIAKAFKVLNG